MSAIGRCASSVVLAVLAALAAAVPLGAASSTGRLLVVVKVSDNAIAGMPARASVLTPDGVLVDYAEELLERSPNTRTFVLEGLPEGIFDVRVEGEGMITEAKKGVPVFAGRDEKAMIVVRPGTGVHIVEHAVAGLSREEVAVRFAQLEAETAKLRTELEALKPPPP